MDGNQKGKEGDGGVRARLELSSLQQRFPKAYYKFQYRYIM